MKRLRTTGWHLMVFALSLGLSGCLGSRPSPPTSSARKPTAAPLPPREQVVAVNPPTPAPALHIPGPVRLPVYPVALAKPAANPPEENALPQPWATLSLAASSDASSPSIPPSIQQSSFDPEPAVKAVPANGATMLPVLVVAAPAQATVAAPPKLPAAVPAVSASPLRVLAKKAVDRLAEMDTYVMRMRRREMIAGTLRPEEVVLCKFRSAPFSVYMKWVGKEANGREVIYVKDRHENKIHTLLAAGDVPLMPAGKHMAFEVDSLLVKANSRHPITDAGLAKMITRFAQIVELSEKGDARAGTLKYLGPIKRPEFDAKVEAVLHTIPPRADPMLPGGGRRLLCFDSTLHLPVVIVTQDDSGQEVEYYCHDRFLIPGQLDDGDFDPSRWSKTKSR